MERACKDEKKIRNHILSVILSVNAVADSDIKVILE